jgi:hypothetical protein
VGLVLLDCFVSGLAAKGSRRRLAMTGASPAMIGMEFCETKLLSSTRSVEPFAQHVFFFFFPEKGDLSLLDKGPLAP